MSTERCLVLPLAKVVTALFWLCSVGLMAAATLIDDTQSRDLIIGWAMLSCGGAVVMTCRLLMQRDHRRLEEMVELHLLMSERRQSESPGERG